MKGFILYLVDKDNNDILLTDYVIGRLNNNALTMNENLNEAEHDRYDLTFNIVDKPFTSAPVDFNFSSSLRIGRELKLFRDGETTDYISLIVSSIVPVLNSSNNLYNVTAQDYASYIWSRNNTGLNFDSFTNEEFIDLNLELNSKNIANYLLSKGNLAPALEGTTNYYGQSTAQTITYADIDDLLWTNGGAVQIGSTISRDTGADITIDLATTFPFIKADANSSIHFWISDNKLQWEEEIYTTGYELTDFTFNISFIEIDYTGAISNWEVDFFDDTDEAKILILNKINLSVSSSNTYNSLIELANLLGALLKINYNSQKIYFISKEDESLSKQYQLSPDFNLEDLSISVDSENFAPLIFVSGGEDEFGLSVGIAPSIPASAIEFLLGGGADIDSPTSKYYTTWYENSDDWRNAAIAADEVEKTLDFIDIADKVPYLDSFLFNILYFEEANLTDDLSDISSIIYNDLRRINYRHQSSIKSKYLYEFDVSQQQSKIESLSELLNSEDVLNFGANQISLKEEFRYFDDSQAEYSYTHETVEDTCTTNGEPTFEYAGTDQVSLEHVSGVQFQTSPISLNTYGSYNNGSFRVIANFDDFDTSCVALWDSTFTIERLTSTDIYEWEWVLDFGTTTIEAQSYAKLNQFYPAEEHQSAYAKTTDNNYVYKSTSVVVGQEDVWVDSDSVYKFEHINFRVVISEGTWVYPWFDMMRLYKGDSLIELKYDYYKDLIVDYIAEEKKNSADINILGIKQSEYTEGDDKWNAIAVDIAYLEERNNQIYAAIGDWDYTESTDTFTKNNFGKYTYLFEAFDDAKDYYDTPSTPADPVVTVYQQYKNSYNEKQNKWFDLKKLYGKFLIEGFYENTLETDPVKLYNEAVLYAYDYSRPQETFSTTMINIGDVIGTELDAVQVGEVVVIRLETLNILNTQEINLQINSISRNLRSLGGVSLEITKYNETEKLIEQLLLGL